MKRYIDPYRRRIPAHRIGYLRLESSVVVIVKYSKFLGDFSDARQRAKVGSRDCAAGRKIARAVLVVATLRDNGVDRAGLYRLGGRLGAMLQPGYGNLSKPSADRRFQLVLVKPSHYSEDGYVIRWWRAIIPSNSLAAIYGVALECIERKVLGPDVDIDLEAIDEFSQRIEIQKLVERFKRHGNFGLVALVGVQSNQYPRALDLARPLRAAGIPVAIGGFHVSGCLSMLDGKAVGLDACREMGVSMFAGEVEGRLDILLRDVAEGRLQPVYNFMKDLPGIEGTPIPFLPITKSAARLA